MFETAFRLRHRILAAGLIAMIGGGASAWAESPPASPSVAELAEAKFTRVVGLAEKEAVLGVGPPDSWHDQAVGLPTVDFDGTTYRMWFVGDTTTTDKTIPYRTPESVGLATSADGVHWKIANEGRPVFEPGPAGGFDSKSICHPFVLRVGDEFWMWYGGIDGRLGWDVGIQSGVRIERIGLAKSRDGIAWKRLSEPVLDIGPTGSGDSIQVSGMHVIRKGKEYWMWYSPYAGTRHRVALATSPDGVRWTKQNGGQPVEGLAGDEQLGPSVYFDGRKFFMLYNHAWEKSWAIFTATSDDGSHWRPADAGKPLLGLPPKGSFATAGPGRNHSCHSSQLVIHGGRAMFWYSGEDGSPPHFNRIGLAIAELPHP